MCMLKNYSWKNFMQLQTMWLGTEMKKLGLKQRMNDFTLIINAMGVEVLKCALIKEKRR